MTWPLILGALLAYLSWDEWRCRRRNAQLMARGRRSTLLRGAGLGDSTIATYRRRQ